MPGDPAENRDVRGNDINPATIGARDPPDNVTTKVIQHDPKDKTEAGVENRQLVTTENISLTVDTNGDDDAEGTPSNPIRTLREAFKRVPFIVQHGVEINVNDGVYDGGVPSTDPAWVTYRKDLGNTNEPFILSGNTTTPTNVVISGTGSGHFNWAVSGRAPHRTVIEGLHIKGQIDPYGSNLTVRNCRIDGRSSESGLSQRAIDGYNSTVEVKDTEINADGGIRCNRGDSYILDNLTGTASAELFTETQAGRLWYRSGNQLLGEFPDTYLYDDFSTRHPTKTRGVAPDSRWQRIRPEWEESVGSITTDGTDFTLANGTEIRTESVMNAGQWVITRQFATTPSSGYTDWIVMDGPGTERVFVRENQGSTISLIKRDDTGTTTLIDGGLMTEDALEHDVKVTRDTAGNWELLFDGTSLGTATDSFNPLPSQHFRVENNMAEDVNLLELYCGPV